MNKELNLIGKSVSFKDDLSYVMTIKKMNGNVAVLQLPKENQYFILGHILMDTKVTTLDHIIFI